MLLRNEGHLLSWTCVILINIQTGFNGRCILFIWTIFRNHKVSLHGGVDWHYTCSIIHVSDILVLNFCTLPGQNVKFSKFFLYLVFLCSLLQWFWLNILEVYMKGSINPLCLVFYTCYHDEFDDWVNYL